MRFWIRMSFGIILLFSTSLLFAHTSLTCPQNSPDNSWRNKTPMIITQGAPAKGETSSLYRQMDHWLSVSFGINKKYLKDTDVFEGQRAHFVISRAHDGTVTVSKEVDIHGRTLILFLGQKFHLKKTPRHPAFPPAVIDHFDR